MADDPTTEDIADENEPEGVRNLRETNKRLAQEAKDGAAARRKLAFYEAGVDMSNPMSDLLYKAYDGELDPDLIKAEAVKYGILHEGDVPPATEPPPPPANDPAQTRQRQLITQETHDPGTPVDEGDPMDKAYATYREDMRAGSTSAEASGAVFGAMFQAAREGKAGFIFDSDEWQSSEAAKSR